MDTDQINIQFEQANRHLKAANSELNRPAEDVVPFMVCRSARFAIAHFFMGFLTSHGIEYNEDASLKALLEKCIAIDDKFNKVDLSAISFANDDEYSAEFDEMENSIDLAEQ